MRFFGNAGDISGEQASNIIKGFENQSKSNQAKKSFRTWYSMYAKPYSKKLYQDPYSAARAEFNPAAKAVGEVKKVADKLVETKKLQEKAAVKAEAAASKGNMAEASQMKKEEVQLAQKAQVIEGQLATRVDEGVKLAKATREAEKAKAEVDIKKTAQAKKYPTLAAVWAKHDALYERDRNSMMQKHKLAELKDNQLENYLKTLPRSMEKDAKLERHRKQAAARRVTEKQELAKLDEREAGKVDARESAAK